MPESRRTVAMWVVALWLWLAVAVLAFVTAFRLERVLAALDRMHRDLREIHRDLFQSTPPDGGRHAPEDSP